MLKVNEISIEHSSEYVITDNAQPRFTLKAHSSDNGAYATAYQIVVKKGDKVFWDSGKTNSDKTANIVYSGAPLEAFSQYTVEATVFDNNNNAAIEASCFETGFMGNSFNGIWITHPIYKQGLKGNPPAFVFKKEFRLQKKLKSARAYVTAMGIYTLQINGSKAGDYFLSPGYTSYKNNLQYQVYNITDMLCNNNCIICSVAGGWACGEFGLLKQNKAFADKPSLLCEIRLEYEDESIQIIKSDESWRVTDNGPVRDASIYDGEVYDARLDINKAVFIGASPAKMRVFPKLRAQYGSPVKAVETLYPVSSYHAKNGVIYDFGQNFAGVVHIKASAKSGQIITVRHAEVLIDGELFTRPLRTAKARFEYICRDGEQEYNPQYTYMGFRYIEVSGIDEKNIEVSALVLTSAYDEEGMFECSDDNINRLQQNIRWGGRSNFVDIPTDCPQRDERLGWTGDIAVFASTACFNFNMTRFLEKWLTDVMSEQTSGGAIPVVVPHVKFLQKLITAGWSDCCVLVPWALYLSTGDESIIKKFYPVVKKYLTGVEKKSSFMSTGKNKYIWNFGFSYGDWCAPNEKQIQWMSKKKWISTAYFANSCNIASLMAEIIGNEQDKKHYKELYKNISEAYRDVFTDKKGKINKEFQTAYVCPLYFGMTNEQEKKSYAKNLAALVEKADNHLTTGFLGTPYLLFALSDNGYSEKAYDVLFQDSCPGWLYEVKAGATTVWERWDALRPDGTVNLGEGAIENSKSAYGGGMVSFNHYANGAVGDWLYRRAAGIEATDAGYKSFCIAPQIDSRLSFVRCEKETLYGKIVSEWHLEKNKFSLCAEVPFNTTAVITMPDGSKYNVLSGKHSFCCNI